MRASGWQLCKFSSDTFHVTCGWCSLKQRWISDYSRLLGSLFLTSHFQIVFKLVVISISQQFMRLGSAPSGASKGCEICRPLTCQQILKCCSLTLVCWAVSWYIYRQNMCVGARDCQRPCCANIFFPSANINWYSNYRPQYCRSA